MYVYVDISRPWRCGGWQSITLDVESSNTIDDVKAKVEDMKGIPRCEQSMFLLEEKRVKLLEDGSRTLADYNIKKASTLYNLLDFRGGMYIHLKPFTGPFVILQVESWDTIENFKAKVEEKDGTPRHEQRLMFAGQELEDGRTLADYNIPVGHTVHLVPPPAPASTHAPPQVAVGNEEEDIPLQTKRTQAANQATPNGHSILDTNGGVLCADYIQGLATSADHGAASQLNYEAKLKQCALHQVKANAFLSVLLSELQAGPPPSVVTELEDLKRELATDRNKEKELEAAISNGHEKEKELEATISKLEATISKLAHKNKVVSARCTSFESQLVALEAENKKTKEQLKIADRKYSRARAAGYAEGLEKFPSTEKGQAFLQKFWEDEKAKWLKSVQFLDHLTEGAFQYFNYGFDSCQKQAEQQGFVGQLNKDAALQEAPELKVWESSDQPE